MCNATLTNGLHLYQTIVEKKKNKSIQWCVPLPNNSEQDFPPLSSLFTYLCQGNASAIFHFQCQRSVTSAWPQANFYLMIVEKLLHLRAVRFSHLEFTQDTK